MPDNEILYNSIAKNRNITVGAKALYFYLLSTTDAEPPNRNEIAYDLNISNQTLGRYLNELTRSGYLTCTQSQENGRFGRNQYILNAGE